MRQLIFAGSSQPGKKDLSLVSESIPVLADPQILRAERAQSTLSASGKRLQPYAFNRNNVYCFHVSSVIFLLLERQQLARDIRDALINQGGGHRAACKAGI